MWLNGKGKKAECAVDIIYDNTFNEDSNRDDLFVRSLQLDSRASHSSETLRFCSRRLQISLAFGRPETFALKRQGVLTLISVD